MNNLVVSFNDCDLIVIEQRVRPKSRAAFTTVLPLYPVHQVVAFHTSLLYYDCATLELLVENVSLGTNDEEP